MLDLVAGFFIGLGMAAYHIVLALTQPELWLDWSNKQSLMRFIYFGASAEFFYVVLLALLLLTAAGLLYKNVMWWSVRALEFTGNTVGRFFAWAGLLMVFQQVIIVFLQRIFRVSEISLGPFGYVFTKGLSWYSEELKLYNAIVICMCCGYTLIQGGHVRVDLLYARSSFRTRKIVDMAGSLLFAIPATLLIWLYGWFFMWRHLIVPKPSASDSLERLLAKSRALRWNVETIGFSPNGFNAYFLFKVLLVLLAGLMLLQAIAFFYRSLLEYREGEESAGRFLDQDPQTSFAPD